jgi:hypothetical protein
MQPQDIASGNSLSSVTEGSELVEKAESRLYKLFIVGLPVAGIA